jgi:hypothetical protein
MSTTQTLNEPMDPFVQNYVPNNDGADDMPSGESAAMHTDDERELKAAEYKRKIRGNIDDTRLKRIKVDSALVDVHLKQVAFGREQSQGKVCKMRDLKEMMDMRLSFVKTPEVEEELYKEFAEQAKKIFHEDAGDAYDAKRAAVYDKEQEAGDKRAAEDDKQEQEANDKRAAANHQRALEQQEANDKRAAADHQRAQEKWAQEQEAIDKRAQVKWAQEQEAIDKRAEEKRNEAKRVKDLAAEEKRVKDIAAEAIRVEKQRVKDLETKKRKEEQEANRVEKQRVKDLAAAETKEKKRIEKRDRVAAVVARGMQDCYRYARL